MRQGRFRDLAKFTRVFQGSFRLDSAAALNSNLWTFGLRPLIGGAADAIAPRSGSGGATARNEKTMPWVAPIHRSGARWTNAASACCRRDAVPGGFYERERWWR